MLLAIPESVTTRFLVATNEKRTPDTRHLRDALPATDLGRTARELLETPRLNVHGGWPVPTGWSTRLTCLGGAAEELHHVLSATRHIVVTSTTVPHPRQAQAARLIARVLTAAVAGRLVDLASDQVLAASTEPDRFRLGDEWIGVFVSLDPHATDRVIVGTAGLHRFGLPELTTRAVPHDHMLTAANLLRAVAYRLYTDHIEPLSTDRPPVTAPTPGRAESRVVPTTPNVQDPVAQTTAKPPAPHASQAHPAPGERGAHIARAPDDRSKPAPINPTRPPVHPPDRPGAAALRVVPEQPGTDPPDRKPSTGEARRPTAASDRPEHAPGEVTAGGHTRASGTASGRPQASGAADGHAQASGTADLRAVPDASAREVSAREVSAREVSAREVSAREVSAPDVSAHEVSASEVSASEVSASDGQGRDATAQTSGGQVGGTGNGFGSFSGRATGRGRVVREVPSEWELDCDDLLRFWGAAPAGAGLLAVRLAEVEGERSERGITLEVLPARRDPRWWSDEAGEVMPQLVTARPE